MGLLQKSKDIKLETRGNPNAVTDIIIDEISTDIKTATNLNLHTLYPAIGFLDGANTLLKFEIKTLTYGYGMNAKAFLNGVPVQEIESYYYKVNSVVKGTYRIWDCANVYNTTAAGGMVEFECKEDSLEWGDSGYVRIAIS